MLPLSGQRKLCFEEPADGACWAERCHQLLLLVDGADIESVAVDNGSTQKEKRRFIPGWLKTYGWLRYDEEKTLHVLRCLPKVQ